MQHILIAIAFDSELDVGSIGTGHIRFGHGECRADLTIEQGHEPRFLLLRCAELRQDFHIARVWSRTVEYLGCPAGSTHDFSKGSIFEVSQTRPILITG